ncbi:LTA synthase family protein [Arcticibacterium luteifluviistationis]|uniref:Sulfatase n=1 Tax=Arcticibacterium luteifluviistationis TaxID=1784714 RepID=A0A2Z4G6S1_9BACT|nr:LTA synthase family protein [Arcticibacterium luteifluviistationis]AWV96841.1 sulfatase [Arcticibacterium luteifluviistationis]
MEKIISKFNLKYPIQVSFTLSFLLILNDTLTILLSGSNVSDSSNIFFNILQTIIIDLAIGGIFILALAVPFILIKKISRLFSEIFLLTIGLIILLANLGLNKYFDTTHLSLGSDLFGYSLSDIIMVINTSTDFSIIGLLPFIVFPIVFVLLNHYMVFININRKAIVYSSFLSLVFLFIGKGLDAKIDTNLSYFLSDSLNYKLDNSQLASQTWDEEKAQYPLLHEINFEDDVLGQHLNLNRKKPNIVMVVVEGLGSDFTGDGAEYPGFTPYLDSLTKVSLYWSNFMSNTGRSFGALPSILGSAPFGEKGFLDIDDTPNHLSLISALKQNGYVTNYYEGGNSSFDNKLKYLNNEGIDFVLDDANFGPGYKKFAEEAGGFSWGYPDAEIYRKTLSLMQPSERSRLDVVLTISNHEPFNFPNRNEYQAKVERIKNDSNFSDSKKSIIDQHINVFSSLLYTDASLKEFMESYKNKADYENTIFIITGDHRLIPVPQKDVICRYHVPLIIFSPMQKLAQEFKGVSSHMDITPSIMTMLKNGYQATLPEEVPWLGQSLNPSTIFANDREIPLMQYKGGFKDFVFNDLYLAGDSFFKIEDNLSLSSLKVEKGKTLLKERYNNHRKLNAYVTTKNKIFPGNTNTGNSTKINFTTVQQQVIDEKTKGLNLSPEQIYFIARELAFEKNYEDALTLISYIENKSPLHFDALTLRGRIYGWNGEYEKAQKQLLFVINRAPLYSDAYSAILDLYWWNDKPSLAARLTKKIEENFANDKAFMIQTRVSMARFNSDELKAGLSAEEELLLENEFLSIMEQRNE